MQGLLIEKMEHRILVGTIAFLGTMLVMGWIAINENARMAAFEQQYQARSIERGAYLFALNCATCHGDDGLGIGGNAPALNNPWMFSHSYTAEIDAAVDQLEFELTQNVSAEQQAEIEARLAELDTERQAIIAQMGPAIDAGYNPDEPNYLAYMGWEGSLEDYIRTTLIHGRPKSALYWPAGRAMVAWAQTGGGPLRMDEIEDLTAYILNWDQGSNWTIEDLNAVNQYMLVPVDPARAGTGEAVEVIGTNDTAEALELVSAFEGDPVVGQELYTGYACAGCHNGGVIGPATEGTWTRTIDVRLQQPEFADYTPEAYLIESILMPNAYIAPGYQGGQMPQNFHEQLSAENLADMLAFLRSQDQPIQ